jgi:GNAT superfamily N-acetyltransferase
VERPVTEHHFMHLKPSHAPVFAGLLAQYAAALSGTEQMLDTARAQGLIDEDCATVWGAFVGEDLAGFAVVYDLPEAVSGLRCGQLDDLYVSPDARGASLAERLIDAICEEGRAKGWVHLRWLAPEGAAAARRLYDRIAVAKPWKSYAISLNPGAEF